MWGIFNYCFLNFKQNHVIIYKVFDFIYKPYFVHYTKC